MSSKWNLINNMRNQSQELQSQADAARLANDGARYTELQSKIGSLENEIITMEGHTEKEIEFYLKHDMI